MGFETFQGKQPKKYFRISRVFDAGMAKRHPQEAAEPLGVICTMLTQREPKDSNKGQARKGAGRMPWHREPKKDVASCEKLRSVASRRYEPQMSEWSNPHSGRLCIPY